MTNISPCHCQPCSSTSYSDRLRRILSKMEESTFHKMGYTLANLYPGDGKWVREQFKMNNGWFYKKGRSRILWFQY